MLQPSTHACTHAHTLSVCCATNSNTSDQNSKPACVCVCVVCRVPCTCVVCRVYMCIRQWKGQHWCVLMGLGSTLPFLYPHFTLTLSLLTLLQALLPSRLFLHPDYSSILSFCFFPSHQSLCTFVLSSLLVLTALITSYFHSQSFLSLFSTLFNLPSIFLCNIKA